MNAFQPFKDDPYLSLGASIIMHAVEKVLLFHGVFLILNDLILIRGVEQCPAYGKS
jgi:hypothetical protein